VPSACARHKKYQSNAVSLASFQIALLARGYARAAVNDFASRGAIFLGRRYPPSYSGLLVEGMQFIPYGIQFRVGQYLLLFRPSDLDLVASYKVVDVALMAPR
jgi:hypothetical protein